MTPRLMILPPALAAAIMACGCAMTRHPLVHDGRQRVYYLYAPSNLAMSASPPAPLVVMLHGFLNTGPDAAEMTQLNTKAKDQGFLVAYPNGIGRSWNARLCCDPALADGIDDVGFIDEVIRDVQSDHAVDPDRIYVAGFSNGGMMAHTIGCEMSDRIAAIASVSGPADPATCNPTGPVPVIMFHGRLDDRVPYEPNSLDPGDPGYPGAVESMDLWEIINNCSTATTQHDGTVEIQRHTGCDMGTEVVLYTLDQGNHSWPGGRRVSPLGQNPTTVISATDLIWEFFEQH